MHKSLQEKPLKFGQQQSEPLDSSHNSISKIDFLKSVKSSSRIPFLGSQKLMVIMTRMSNKEIKKFLMQGTMTAKLATVKKDKSPHIAPVWFVLDESHTRGRIGEIVFMTGIESIKAKNIQRDNRVSICVDDQIPPFSFVTIFGIARIFHHSQTTLFRWATKIA